MYCSLTVFNHFTSRVRTTYPDSNPSSIPLTSVTLTAADHPHNCWNGSDTGNKSGTMTARPQFFKKRRSKHTWLKRRIFKCVPKNVHSCELPCEKKVIFVLFQSFVNFGQIWGSGKGGPPCIQEYSGHFHTTNC